MDPQIDIYHYDYGFDVCISRMRKLPDGEMGRSATQCGPVTTSTLLRAHRAQLAILDPAWVDPRDAKIAALEGEIAAKDGYCDDLEEQVKALDSNNDQLISIIQARVTRIAELEALYKTTALASIEAQDKIEALEEDKRQLFVANGAFLERINEQALRIAALEARITELMTR